MPRRRPRPLPPTVLVAGLVLSSLVLTSCGAGSPSPAVAPVSETAAPSAGTSPDPASAAAHFLAEYVDDDGRVVRRDQGGDTVSEGQAYGLLLAVQAGDEDAAHRIWSWTEDHLLREDGLMSWRWEDGAVVDVNSASDADLYAAHALVLAGERFDASDLRSAGEDLARAVLDHETVGTGAGRVLLAGNWAWTSRPWAVNPSYVVPMAVDALAQAVPDSRWAELRTGSAAVLRQLLAASPLPPDWAEVADDGSATAVAAPAGGPGAESRPGFGLDAARIVVQQTVSCDGEDRETAAALARVLVRDPDDVRGRYDLQGRATVDWSHPLALVAAAAAAGADGDDARERSLLTAAAALDAENPTYYGAAWVALGAGMLTPDAEDPLGGCGDGGS